MEVFSGQVEQAMLDLRNDFKDLLRPSTTTDLHLKIGKFPKSSFRVSKLER
jgi:hypothetical protein